MNNLNVDVAIIGGGPAGLAASLEAKKHSDGDIIILERNRWMGGILPQCIHDGFGVEEIGESLTGPEYAERYIQQAQKQGIRLFTKTMVTQINKKHEILCINKKGLHKIVAKAIVLSTGCREKTRWDVMIPGDRPSGIFTAGTAQGLINLYNIIPGRTFFILGSGDVGLIMARRLTLEGAKVAGVAEILPYATGIPRNIVQCLDDFDIPLLLNHTVHKVRGCGRVENVTVIKVDESLHPVKGTETKIKCDTLLLSLGLIPENELARSMNIHIDSYTGGPYINQNFETSIDGIFTVGNSLQVYDTVDMLCKDAKKAGSYIGKYILGENRKKKSSCKTGTIRLIPGNGVKHLTPHLINPIYRINPICLTFRAARPISPAVLCVTSDDKKVVYTKNLPYVSPANLSQVPILFPEETLQKNCVCEVTLDG